MSMRRLMGVVVLGWVVAWAGVVSAGETPATGTASRSPSESGSDHDHDPERPRKAVETATFGGGCFWSMEAIFERVPGVRSVVSGFAGGFVPNPTYEMVCTGRTGHAEVVRIVYDPRVVSYETLLKIFWMSHDPTTPNSQGDDHGPQYRSIILYETDDQKDAARQSYRRLKAARAFRSPIVTELAPLTAFYPAEPYHQDYYQNHWAEPYSMTVIEPKLWKLESRLHPRTRSKAKARR
jgi:peptide-methionine (S)-S-oxide reductase